MRLSEKQINSFLFAVEGVGADLINTGIGWHEARVPTIAAIVPRGAFTWVTRRLKEKVTLPLIASNRIGREEQDGYDITFYGSSFIADEFGAKVEELDETSEGALVHQFDLDKLEHIRSAWGVFRDRRPNLYSPIKTLDGSLES